MKKIYDLLFGLLGIVAWLLMGFLGVITLYGIVQDLMAKEIVWAFVDIFTVISGTIRGIMYLFGYL
ncbi:hypothetical protein ACLSYV_04950 [Avibacterium avium]|uniref:hypothetical protein n=1 Tax=Avibacterium avium TaxID=751 RepID=UPI003BF7BA81